MTYSAPLPNTGVILPVPGSGQAWEVSVFNADFTGVENAITADRARISTVEGKVANNAVIPAGSTASRDGFYGAPGSAAARIALANAAPRWFNTDLGYVERYFAAAADSGTAGFNAKYARFAAGWFSESAGLVPINPGSVTPVGAGSVATVIGNNVKFSNCTGVQVNNTLPQGFSKFLVKATFDSVANINLIARLRLGAADDISANYSRETLSAVNAAVSSGATPSDTTWYLTGSPVNNGFADIEFYNPNRPSASWMKSFFYGTNGATQVISQSGDVHNAVTAFDGFAIHCAAAGVMAGNFQIYGYAGGDF